MILWTDTKGFNNKSNHPKILWCIVNDTLHPLSLWQALLMALSTPEEVRPWHERGQRVSELGSGWTHWPSFPSPSSGSGPGFNYVIIPSKQKKSELSRLPSRVVSRNWHRQSGASKCLSKFSLRYIWAASTGRNPRTFLRVSVTILWRAVIWQPRPLIGVITWLLSINCVGWEGNAISPKNGMNF